MKGNKGNIKWLCSIPETTASKIQPGASSVSGGKAGLNKGRQVAYSIWPCPDWLVDKESGVGLHSQTLILFTEVRFTNIAGIYMKIALPTTYTTVLFCFCFTFLRVRRRSSEGVKFKRYGLNGREFTKTDLLKWAWLLYLTLRNTLGCPTQPSSFHFPPCHFPLPPSLSDSHPRWLAVC